MRALVVEDEDAIEEEGDAAGLSEVAVFIEMGPAEDDVAGFAGQRGAGRSQCVGQERASHLGIRA